MLLIPQVQKRSKLTGGSENDIPAVSAVTAVGTPSRNVFFPSEADATVAAIPGFNKYFDLIDKHKFNDESSLMGAWRACLPLPVRQGGQAGPKQCGRLLLSKLNFEIETYRAGSGTG